MTEPTGPEPSAPDEPAPAAAPAAGAIPGVRLLSGRYQLAGILGYGGMAEVYKATDVRLGRSVAIKVLRSDLARDPTFQARFRREAQSAAGLNHPMIVSVYDTGTDDKHDPPLPYIVMEYVDGHTVREVLQLDGRLTQNRALEIVVDVCAALDYSHRAGIVHRDIKPGNVMITPDGSVKVMDFGIARAIAQSTATVTQTAAVMGTAQYLSPEQARGETVDSRSDLYSAGVVLYELLTGQPPFQGDSPVAVAYQHVREDPIPPSDLEPDLSADVDAVVMKSLAKNPANRYQNAAEMSDDLGRILAGRHVLATPLLREPAPRPAPPPRRQRPDRPRPSRRRILLVALLTLLAAAAVTGGLLLAQDSKTGSSEVAVPPLQRVTLTDAKRLIEDNGLEVGKLTGKASPLPVYTVLSSDPSVGTKVKKGTAVALTFSAGPNSVQIPINIIGKTAQAAQAELTQLGFQSTISLVVTPGKPIGTVSDTSPLPGTSVLTTQPVTLKVEGPNTVVPQLLGFDVDAATALLLQADLRVNVVLTPSGQPNQQVLSQSIPQGTQLKRLTIVTLTVSQNLPPTPDPDPDAQADQERETDEADSDTHALDGDDDAGATRGAQAVVSGADQQA